MEKTEIKPGFTYYVFAVFVVLALAAVSLIPAAMAYNVRTFTGDHIPEWLAQAISITILLAPTIAILATGFTRVFAVTDAEHAQALTLAAVLEGIACGCEICAALIGGDEWYSRLGRIVFLAGATGAVFAALVLTLSRNGLYKLTIAKNEMRLLWHKEFSQLMQEEMRTDTARLEMRRAILFNIQDATERQAGRQLYARETFGLVEDDEDEYPLSNSQPRVVYVPSNDVPIPANGNGNHNGNGSKPRGRKGESGGNFTT